MHEQQQRAKSSRDERGGGRSNSRRRRPEEGRADTGARRVIVELGNLERALTKGDFLLEQAPLQEILRTIRSMRLSSLEQLEPNARGRLITSMFRVMRQKKPANLEEILAPAEALAAVVVSPAEAGVAESEVSSEASVGQEPSSAVESGEQAEVVSAELSAEVPADKEPSSVVEEVVSEVSAGESAAAATEAKEGIALSPEQLQAQAYRSVLELVGRIWRALGEKARSQAALEASGLSALSEEAPLPAEPAKRMPAERASKDKRREKPVRVDAGLTFKDWRDQAVYLEQSRKTRDAGRLHEKNASFAEAARLFELGNDLKSALRCSVLAEDEATSGRLMSRMSPSDVKFILERLAAWGLLMSYCARTKDYEAVARLYERARQMDQAALAWEKAGRLSLARKAYEQAGDLEAANRTRAIEVQQLVDRGDRLGAATLLVATGNIQAAITLLKELPGPKAYKFLLKLKLEGEAQEFATAQIEQAIATEDHLSHAHWLEALNQLPEAIEAWLKAGRRDKAMFLCEKAEKYEQAAELAEALGRLNKAEALFRQAGNEEQAARITALLHPTDVPADPSSLSESQASEVM